MSRESKVTVAFQYLALAFVSASILAYELFVMRVFACAGWSHFGSLVISIVMLGFGIFSTVFCIRKEFFQKHLFLWIQISLFLLGPLMVAGNSLAQQVRFNPIFLVSDPNQKYLLGSYFLIYLFPFLLGAMFLGLIFFLKRETFGTAYFANMAGSAIGGAAIFASMYYLVPERLLIVPLLLWIFGSLLWFCGSGAGKRAYGLIALAAVLSISGSFWFEQVKVSEFKAVSYARQFPDFRRESHRASPFGLLEIYSSSYFHFAPGLSDNAMMYLDEIPKNTFIGMYIDGDGPMGVMRNLTGKQSEYFNFLPMRMPFLLKTSPEVLVIQFGGGISTRLALSMNAGKVTIAEGNPLIVETLRKDAFVSDFTGRILDDPKVRLVENDGRIYVKQTTDRFDLIDISLADSTGLSSPGGSSIQEKYTYTVETLSDCMNALQKDGILSITVWNKEDPPKSTLKLATTLAQAASKSDSKMGNRFFAAQNYLSTLSVLYKKNGFSAAEIKALVDYCKRMSFEPVYYPDSGGGIPEERLDRLDQYKSGFFQAGNDPGSSEDGEDLSMGDLYRLMLSKIFNGDYNSIQDRYIFKIEPLTNDGPYFAGYTSSWDLSLILKRLDSLTDEWGYLLAWATLLLSSFFGFLLLAIPVICCRRAFFSKEPGKVGIILYFICLGIGYIGIEIVYISKCVICLGNPSVSFAVLVTGMVLFSGLGSYFSERLHSTAGRVLPLICAMISGILLLYAFTLDQLLSVAGMWSYFGRISYCLLLLFPLAFLLGLPFAMGMTALAKSGREGFFVWAWGINGSFSVVGSVMVPVIAVNSGFFILLLLCAALYLIAIPPFLSFQSHKAPKLIESVVPIALLLLVFSASGNTVYAGQYKEQAITFTAQMKNAPFPYEAIHGDTETDFYDFINPQTGKRFHTNRYGERFSEEDHYSDSSVLFHLPPSFDPGKPFVFLVFFHSLKSNIHKENREFLIGNQVDDSGRNVVLIMPQLARNAVDSSPGKLFQPNAFRNFMLEAAEILSEKLGEGALSRLRTAPIVLSAFSGGYKAAAYILDRGGEDQRIKGVFLMDALYEDVPKFRKWIADDAQNRFFLLLFAEGMCEKKAAELGQELAGQGIEPGRMWPGSIQPGKVFMIRSQHEHLKIPVLGPPRFPVASFLRILDEGVFEVRG